MLTAVVLGGCGRIAFDPMPDGEESCALGSWSAPVEVTELSSPSNDWEPTLSSDGQLLVFSSDRDGALHLYASNRMSDGSFSPPSRIEALSTAATEYGPAWFASDRLYFDRGSSQIELYTSDYVGAEFQPSTGVAELASATVEAPAISSDELEMFYSTSFQLRRATRETSGDPWMLAGAVTELDSGSGEAYPTLSRDRLVIYFESDRVNPMGDIYVATRPTTDAPFESIRSVTELNASGGSAGTSDPDLSPDGRTMLLASQRPGGTGAWDIYLSTRGCE